MGNSTSALSVQHIRTVSRIIGSRTVLYLATTLSTGTGWRKAMVSMIIIRVVSLVIFPLCDGMPTSNITLHNTEMASKQISPYVFIVFLTIVVLDKLGNGVHVDSRDYRFSLFAQQEIHVCFAVLEKVFC